MKPTPLHLCLGLLLLEGARADLLFYEGFDYAPGEDRLQAVGYTPSTSGADGDVIEGSLSYVDAAGNRLRTTGNRASLDGTDETANVTDVRPLNLAGAKTNTVWFSCVGQQTGGGLAKFFNVSIRTVDDSVVPPDANKADDELIAIGLPATTDPAPPARWGLTDRSAGEGRRFIYFPTPTTEKAFLVVRVDLNHVGAKERFTMWVNPQLGAEPSEITGQGEISADSDAPDWSAVNFIRLQAAIAAAPFESATWEVDEIRIGDTWADVAPYDPPFRVLSTAPLPSGGLRVSWQTAPGRQDVVAWSTDAISWTPYPGSTRTGVAGESPSSFDAAPPVGGSGTFFVRIERMP